MKKVFNKCFIILGVILNIQMVNAQRVALKSNLIDWATLSPNLAVEMRSALASQSAGITGMSHRARPRDGEKLYL